jgi:hypothetical protein
LSKLSSVVERHQRSITVLEEYDELMNYIKCVLDSLKTSGNVDANYLEFNVAHKFFTGALSLQLEKIIDKQPIIISPKKKSFSHRM